MLLVSCEVFGNDGDVSRSKGAGVGLGEEEPNRALAEFLRPQLVQKKSADTVELPMDDL
jgi:hypothetical protein